MPHPRPPANNATGSHNTIPCRPATESASTHPQKNHKWASVKSKAGEYPVWGYPTAAANAAWFLPPAPQNSPPPFPHNRASLPCRIHHPAHCSNSSWSAAESQYPHTAGGDMRLFSYPQPDSCFPSARESLRQSRSPPPAVCPALSVPPKARNPLPPLSQSEESHSRRRAALRSRGTSFLHIMPPHHRMQCPRIPSA